MAPERSPKRQKTLNEPKSEPQPPTATKPAQIPAARDVSSTSIANSVESGGGLLRSSFFSSWSRSRPPMAETTHDIIKTPGSLTSNVASSIRDITPRPKSLRSPSLAMTLGKGKSSRASPVDATTTIVHAEVKSPSRDSTRSSPIDLMNAQSPHETRARAIKDEDVPKNDTPKLLPTKLPATTEVQETNVLPQVEPTRTGWLAWLARGDGQGGSGMANTDNDTITPSQQVENDIEKSKATSNQQNLRPTDVPPLKVEQPLEGSQNPRRSWLPLWNSDSPNKSEPNTPEIETRDRNDGRIILEQPKIVPRPNFANGQSIAAPKVSEPPLVSSTPPPPTNLLPPPPLPSTQDNNKASAWSFWSRETKSTGPASSIVKNKDGEVPIPDTVLQEKPVKAATKVPERQVEPKYDTKGSKMEQSSSNKPTFAATEDITKPHSRKTSAVIKQDDLKPSGSSDSLASKGHKQKDSKSGESIKAESFNAKAIAIEPTQGQLSAATKTLRSTHNLLLPALHSTLKIPTNPSLLNRMAHLLYTTREQNSRHLSLVKEPQRLRSALAIGIHGYFPAPLIRSVLGQPTGTSVKFADMASKSITRWTKAHGYEVQVKTAALEGEGKISDRVELLWKLLLNWIEDIRKSDFIMIACHSQGVPVAVMLVAKLIQFGCISSGKVGICAMAGVNMGPFPEYKSRWIGGSAGELFEFSNSSSRVSTDYMAALETVLKFGVRVTFVGSIDDQLVSLESSLFAPLSHPHIFRAVSIDAKIHAPNFLSHLVGFVLKLRNLGIQDHGLLRELSSPLAGSLYSGEGHSRLYEDEAVYDLAVSFSLETDSRVGVPVVQRNTIAGGGNPYILPFAMRGILEEELVKTELQHEVTELLKEFDDWKPTTKALKDVKFRLEGIRSRL